jgi:hypothetical protein
LSQRKKKEKEEKKGGKEEEKKERRQERKERREEKKGEKEREKEEERKREGRGKEGGKREEEGQDSCDEESFWMIKSRMPHGTARAAHVRLCGELTAHTVRVVKKIEKKKLIRFHPSFPPVHGRGPPSPKLIFFRPKK